MKFNRQELLDILTAIKPGLAQKAIVDQATHFIFTGDRVLTYNDRICISYPLKTEFSCSVSAEEFYKILDKIPDDEISIEFDESKLKIQGYRVRALLVTETGENVLSFVEILNLDKVKDRSFDLPEDFMEAIKLCVFSTAKDLSNPALSCLFVNEDLIASTDDLRISEYKMKKSMGCSFLLPASSVLELIKFEPIKFVFTKENSWIHFLMKNDVIFCSRLINDKFPDYTKFLTGFDNNDQIVLPDDMAELVEMASILVDEEINYNQEIEVQIDKGKIKCKGHNKMGWIESERRIQTKLSIRFIVGGQFFLNILAHTHLIFFDEGKALFKSGEFRHVIALKGE